MEEKFTITSFQQAKNEKRKITMLTAYDYSTAKIVDAAGVDAVLVGDSLGMVMLGYESTLPVTVDDIIYHTKAVKRGTKRALIVSDMPFLSYHVSKEEAIKNAGRIIKEGGAEAVKVEGGVHYAETIRAIVDAQIPVMGHIGLTPQSVNVFGGFKVQGKSVADAKQIVEDAKALEEAGVFSITLEGIPAELSKIISENIQIPTIGIGAGSDCDGQVLVVNDMLGMFTNFIPKFVKQFANLETEMNNAIRKYIAEVRDGSFPAKEHTYFIAPEVIEEVRKLV